MKFKVKLRLLFLVSILSLNIKCQDIAFKKEIIDNMINAIENQNDLEFIMERNERNKKGFHKGSFYAKMRNKPFKLYIKNFKPKEGSEILYVDGENNNKALINPNFFPYINISLRPENSLLLAGGHHCVKELGFNFIHKTFKHYKKIYGNNFYSMMKYEGIYKWDNRRCYKLIIDYKDYKTSLYNANEGETLYDIARREFLNIGKLREYNPNVDADEQLRENQQLTIHSHYAKKSVLFIDIENYFPIYQILYDEEGLYERYSFSNLIINKTFKEEEFESNYEAYDF